MPNQPSTMAPGMQQLNQVFGQMNQLQNQMLGLQSSFDFWVMHGGNEEESEEEEEEDEEEEKEEESTEPPAESPPVSSKEFLQFTKNRTKSPEGDGANIR